MRGVLGLRGHGILRTPGKIIFKIPYSTGHQLQYQCVPVKSLRYFHIMHSPAILHGTNPLLYCFDFVLLERHLFSPAVYGIAFYPCLQKMVMIQATKGNGWAMADGDIRFDKNTVTPANGLYAIPGGANGDEDYQDEEDDDDVDDDVDLDDDDDLDTDAVADDDDTADLDDVEIDEDDLDDDDDLFLDEDDEDEDEDEV